MICSTRSRTYNLKELVKVKIAVGFVNIALATSFSIQCLNLPCLICASHKEGLDS